MTTIYSKQLLTEDKPRAQFAAGLDLRNHVRELSGGAHPIYEFVGADTFGTEWNQRRAYEVAAGRDQEPILYAPIYNTINDPSLPENVTVYKLGPGGVILEEVFDGGEVKFASVTSSDQAVRIRHYGVGLEYSDDLVAYNQLWRAAIVERQAGIAYNALLNHVHLSPILSYSYAAANQTAANTAGATLVEDYMLTLEDAIVAATNDTANPRRGPYVLLCSTANLFTIEKALTRVPQQGVTLQSSAIDQIRAVIAYNGWTGTRGGKSVTYSGVTTGKAYLIDIANRDEDFQSYMKNDLMQYGMQEDVSRFMTQIVWHTRFGAYANPLRAVEEITLPT